MSNSTFPKDFLWGVATSAYQIEGAAFIDGRGLSIWDTFCRLKSVISDGSSGDVACDHYHHLQEDLDIIASLQVHAYRFSVSWPRIQPAGRGPTNPKGLDFYERLVDGLLKRNITPFLTLYHWDLPESLQALGGWPTRDIAFYFADYAEVIARHFGDRIQFIVTHNEPWVVATLGYEKGIFAPGIKNRKLAYQAAHHLLFSHGLAVNAMRSNRKHLKCGIALNLAPFHTHAGDDADIAQAKFEDGQLIRWYMDPLFRGEYPADIVNKLGDDAPTALPGDFEVIRSPIDFLGVNYYTRVVVNSADKSKRGPQTYETTDMGWEIYPKGFTELVVRLKRDYDIPPIYVTENGAAFADVLNDGRVHDHKRTEFLQLHTTAVAEAIAAGVNIRGYFVWSLFDNFEWGDGYTKRFGIVYVDYATQERIPKESALWYRNFITSLNK